MQIVFSNKQHISLLNPGAMTDVFMVFSSSEKQKHYLQHLSQPGKTLGYNEQCTMLIPNVLWYILSNSESQKGCGNATEGVNN
jgi:hypothetical protein